MKKNNLAINTILLGIGTLLSKGLLFIMIPFFTRWLSTEDYGSFDLFCTYVSLLIPFISLATGEAVFRFSIESKATDKDRKEYISNGFTVVIVNFMIVMIIIIAVEVVSGWVYAIPFILLLFGELINNYLRSFLRAIKKLNVYSFCSAGTVIFIAIFVTVFVKYLEMGLDGIILGYAAGYIIGDLGIVLVSHFHEYFEFRCISKDGIAKLLRYSYPLIPNSVSWWIINVSDRFLLNTFIGPFANGIYALANKIPGICSTVFGVFNISWQEAASDIVEYGTIEEKNNYFSGVYNSLIKRIISVCIGVVSLNYVFFRWVFDIAYIDAYKYSPLLITAIIFMLLSQYYGGIQIALKMPKENGTTTMLGAVCNVLVNLLTIRYLGIYAATISTLVAYAVVNYLRKRKLTKRIHFKMDKATYIFIAIYGYFFVASYFIFHTVFSSINLIAACVVFFVINRDMIGRYCNIIKRKLVRK